MNKLNICKERLKVVRNEYKVLRKLDHPGIVQFRNKYETKAFLLLEMEYVEGG